MKHPNSLLRSSRCALLAALAFTTLGHSAEKNSGIAIDWNNETLHAPPGQPVPPSVNLDPRYAPDALLETFHALARRLGANVLRVSVDRSEYPFLVHGVLEGRRTHHELRDTLNTFRGYAYSGSATLSTSNTTCFALNLTPQSEYPRAARQAISARLMARLTKLRDAERHR